MLRYISPVLAFGTERRYLTIGFCYRLQIELKLLLASKEEILILKFIKVKTTFTTVKVFTLNKKWKACVKRSKDKIVIDNKKVQDEDKKSR